MTGQRHEARRLLLQTYQVLANPHDDGEFEKPPSAAEKVGSQTQSQQPFDSSMGLTILVLLTALFFMGFFSIYIRRFAHESPVDISRRRRLRSGYSGATASPVRRICTRKGLDFAEIKSLPVLNYTTGFGKHPIVVDCPVCLTEFEEGECVKMLPSCQHLFHPECIDTWLLSRASCPICRASRLFAAAARQEEQAAAVEMAAWGGGHDVATEGGMSRCCSWSSMVVVESEQRGGLQRTRSY
ncbi:hypothetical protein QQ045_029541 [Rhodiola kirilowii]